MTTSTFDNKDNYIETIYYSRFPLQSRELNDQQKELLYQISQLSLQLVNDCTFKTGGNVNYISENEVNMQTSEVYIGGLLLYVPEKTLLLVHNEENIVGLVLRKLEVTSETVTSLNETDENSLNYGKRGASRLKYDVYWKLKSQVTGVETFYEILRINDGNIVSNKNNIQLEQKPTERLIEEYDHELYDNHIVNGLSTIYVGYDTTKEKHHFAITSGIARILGVKLDSQFAKSVFIDKITETEDVLGEPVVYNTGKVNFPLRKKPLDLILKVQGTKTSLSTITHGGYSGVADLIPNTPVINILAINQGGVYNGSEFVGGRTYSATYDYSLNGDFIDWSKLGNEPSVGSTYNILYTHTFTHVADINDGYDGFVLPPDIGINDNSIMLVDYRVYKKRIDRISIDYNGNPIISKGAAKYNNATAPQKQKNMLSLCTIYLTHDNEPLISSDTQRIIPLSELQSLQESVRSLQYEVARLGLISNISSNNSIINRRGFVVDAFLNNSMIDLGKENTAIISDGILRIPNVFNTNYYSNELHSLPIKEVIIDGNPYITNGIKINQLQNTSVVGMAYVDTTPSQITLKQWEFSKTNPIVTFSDTALSLKLINYNINEVVVIYLNNQEIAQVVIESSIQNLSVVIPQNTIKGVHRIIAIGRKSLKTGVYLLRIDNDYQQWELENQQFVEPLLNLNIDQSVDDKWSVILQDAYQKGFNVENWLNHWCKKNVSYLSQYVSANESYDLFSIDIYIGNEKPTEDVILELMGIQKNYPNSNDILSYGILKSGDIEKNNWNNVKLKYPVRILKNKHFFISIKTTSIVGIVGVANVGEYDNRKYTVVAEKNDNQLYVYNDNSTTLLRNKYLAYRFHVANYDYFNDYEKVILTASNLENITQWLLVLDQNIPIECNVKYYLKYGASYYEIKENEVLTTNPISGTAVIVAIFNGTELVSPYIKNVELFASNLVKHCVYTQNKINTDSITSVKLFINEKIPSLSNAIYSIEKNENEYDTMTRESITPTGDDWYESCYIATLNDGQLNLRLKIEMTAHGLEVPQLKNLRLILL